MPDNVSAAAKSSSIGLFIELAFLQLGTVGIHPAVEFGQPSGADEGFQPTPHLEHYFLAVAMDDFGVAN